MRNTRLPFGGVVAGLLALTLGGCTQQTVTGCDLVVPPGDVLADAPPDVVADDGQVADLVADLVADTVPEAADAVADSLPEEVPDLIPTDIGPDDPGAANDVELPQPSPASVFGRVVVLGWGPLPQAALALDGAGSVSPGPDGTFRFDGLLPGDHVLEATAGELPVTRVNLTLEEGEGRDLGNVAVAPGRRIVEADEGQAQFTLAGTHQALFWSPGRTGIWDGDLHQAFDLPVGSGAFYPEVVSSPGGRVRLIQRQGSVAAWLPSERRGMLLSDSNYGGEFVFDRSERWIAGETGDWSARSLVIVDLDTGARSEIPGARMRPAFTADGKALLYCGAPVDGSGAGILSLRDLESGTTQSLHDACADVRQLAPGPGDILRVLMPSQPLGSFAPGDLGYWEEGMGSARRLGQQATWYETTADGRAVAFLADARATSAGAIGGDLRAWEVGSTDEPITVAADSTAYVWWLGEGLWAAGLQGVHAAVGDGPRSVLVVASLDGDDRVEIASDVQAEGVQVSPDGRSLAALAQVGTMEAGSQGDLWAWTIGQAQARLVSRGAALMSVAFGDQNRRLSFLGGDQPGDWDAFARAGRWQQVDLRDGTSRDLGNRCVQAIAQDPAQRWAIRPCDVDDLAVNGTLRLVDLATGESVPLGPWHDPRAQWDPTLGAGFSADGSILWWITPVEGDGSSYEPHLAHVGTGGLAAPHLDLPGTVDFGDPLGIFTSGGYLLWLGTPYAADPGGWTLRWADAGTGDVRTLGQGVRYLGDQDLSPDGRMFRFHGDWTGLRGRWWWVDLSSPEPVRVTDNVRPEDNWWSPAWDRVLGISVSAFSDDGPLAAWTLGDGGPREVDASVSRDGIVPDGNVRRVAYRGVKAGTNSVGTLRVAGLEPASLPVFLDLPVEAGIAWAGSDLLYGVRQSATGRSGIYVLQVPDPLPAAER